jgi:hypothetical protein
MVTSFISDNPFLGKYGFYNYVDEAHVLSKDHEEL